MKAVATRIWRGGIEVMHSGAILPEVLSLVKPGSAGGRLIGLIIAIDRLSCSPTPKGTNRISNCDPKRSANGCHKNHKCRKKS